MTQPDTVQLAAFGENLAAAFYEDRGATIADRNVRYRSGEIDLICVEPDDTTVFVEVKTRSGEDFGVAESITRTKFARMRRAAALWLDQRAWTEVRFDALCLTLQPDGAFNIDHYEGIDDGAC